MAEHAEFLVRNVLRKEDIVNVDGSVEIGDIGSVNVIRKEPNGTDKITTIAIGGEEQIPLQGPEVSLVINAPKGIKDTKYCPIKVKSDVDLNVAYSRTNSNWTINIVPNKLNTTAPTTVNVDVGEEKPG